VFACPAALLLNDKARSCVRGLISAQAVATGTALARTPIIDNECQLRGSAQCKMREDTDDSRRASARLIMRESITLRKKRALHEPLLLMSGLVVAPIL